MLKNPLRKLRSKYNVCIFVWKEGAWNSKEEITDILNKDKPNRKPSVREIIKARKSNDPKTLENVLLLSLQYKTKKIGENQYVTAVDTVIPQPKIQAHLQMIAINYAKFLDDKIDRVLTYEQFLEEFRGVKLNE